MSLECESGKRLLTRISNPVLLGRLLDKGSLSLYVVFAVTNLIAPDPDLDLTVFVRQAFTPDVFAICVLTASSYFRGFVDVLLVNRFWQATILQILALRLLIPAEVVLGESDSPIIIAGFFCPRRSTFPIAHCCGAPEVAMRSSPTNSLLYRLSCS
jgi:hypothetical protein